MNINKCSVCERVEPLGIDDRCKDCLEDNKKDYNKIEKRIEEINLEIDELVQEKLRLERLMEE